MSDTFAWPWSAQEHRALLALVKPVLEPLRSFRTPVTGEPVDPSHMRAIVAFIQQDDSLGRMDSFLRLAPRSYMARYTRSAGPQLDMACQQARRVIGEVRRILPNGSDGVKAQAVVFVLGHVARMMRTQERGDERRGGGKLAEAGDRGPGLAGVRAGSR